MRDVARHEAEVRKLREATLESPGELDPALRGAAAAGGPLPEPAQRYVDTVRRHAYRVVDGDVDALREAGWSDEAIFELTLAAALGAGLDRLAAGLEAL